MALALDYGHGIPEEGVKHYEFEGRDFRIDEWEVNRKIARRIMNYLQKEGFKYRTYDVVGDCFVDDIIHCWEDLCKDNVSLSTRIARVNEQYKHNKFRLLISLHHNLFDPSGTGKGKGTTPRGSMIGIAHNASKESERIAGVFAQVYGSHLISANIHPKKVDETWAKWPGRPHHMLVKREWAMVTQTHPPALLTELGFMSNYKEARLLTSGEHQRLEAHYIVDAIKAAFPELFFPWASEDTQ